MMRAIGQATVVLVAFTIAAGSVRAQQGSGERRRLVVIDLTGRPVPNARVRVADRRTLVTDDRGVVVIDSLPSGAIAIDVTAIGYVPERRTLRGRAGTAGTAPADTVVLTSLESVLDTVRISERGPIGFDFRRRGSVGQFITAGDIEREQPRNIMSLIRPRDGMRINIDSNGIPSIEMTGGDKGRNCKPLTLVDGFPPRPAEAGPGASALDRAMRLADIGGVEIYLNPAKVPPQFAIWGIRACGAVLFWTRQALGLPPASAALQRP